MPIVATLLSRYVACLLTSEDTIINISYMYPDAPLFTLDVVQHSIVMRG